MRYICYVSEVQGCIYRQFRSALTYAFVPVDIVHTVRDLAMDSILRFENELVRWLKDKANLMSLSTPQS